MSTPRRSRAAALALGILAIAGTAPPTAASRGHAAVTVRACVVRHASVEIRGRRLDEGDAPLVRASSNGAALRSHTRILEATPDRGAVRVVTLFAP
jgi:hypothetical protein